MRSDLMKKGLEKAPHRSLMKAVGLTDEEIARPLVGIANSWNEIVPGHTHLRDIVEAVKAGVRIAGGTPLEFGVIGACDGLAMNHPGMKYSLASRELIADSVEVMVMAQPFDALVLVPNCDKIIPGMIMAALRLNIPAIVVSGGPMLAGRRGGKAVDLISVFEGVGAVKAKKMSAAELAELEDSACPTCGSCSGMFTANSMNCLTEAIGLGLPGNGTIPAVTAARRRLAKHAGMQVMELLRRDIRPRDIVTKKAMANAIAVDMALGASSNTVLHLPAIAKEAGFTLDLETFNKVSRTVRRLCHVSPGGPLAPRGHRRRRRHPGRDGRTGEGRPDQPLDDDGRAARRPASCSRRRACATPRSSAPGTTRSRRRAASRSCSATSPPAARSSSSPASPPT